MLIMAVVQGYTGSSEAEKSKHAGRAKHITAAFSEGEVKYCCRLNDKVEIEEWNKFLKGLTLRSNSSLQFTESCMFNSPPNTIVMLLEKADKPWTKQHRHNYFERLPN